MKLIRVLFWLLSRPFYWLAYPFLKLFDLLIDGRNPYAQRYATEDLVADAQWTIRHQEARGARKLVWVSLIVVAALLVWSAYGLIDEVVRGTGKVVPSRQLQVIQSLDGGIVESILVRPGERVDEGQVLLRIDPTRYSSSLGENQAERLSLLAKAARLRALASGEDFIPPEEVLEQAPEIADSERQVWQSRTRELEATLRIAHEQLRQRQQELAETQANLDQANTSCNLTSQELRVTEPLVKSGAVSQVEVLRLRRDVARFCGEAKAAAAQITRIEAAIDEASTKIEESELNMRNEAHRDLQDTTAKLATLQETRVALQDRVKLAEVRSPVRGVINNMMINTIGGVVQPGKDILDIVPSDDTLLLEVKINPRDIGFLHPGQGADVKFTAYDFAIYGGLKGYVEHIGADAITDEKDNSYYLVNVRTDSAYVGEEERAILPGMQAEVHILTGKRSLMHYLLKPILRASENALRER
ncbi:HlyD family type I secretion periplasmic adaptor subunit [Castellaniella sp.]|uniref:HlyD family type I secretion periplasmic adaptor subunit n=1 Tax=Castellaniella sp. TaxID=1955812 RepID=UPI003560F62A